MKKLISLVIALVMICGLAVAAYAANIDVSVNTNKIDAGETVVVTIELEQDIDISEGATMMQGELHYDGSVLEFQSVEKSEQLSNAAKHAKQDKVLFHYLSLDNSPVGFKAGVLVTVTFKALEDISADHVNTVLTFKNAYVQNAQGKNVGDLTYNSTVSALVCKEHTWNDGEVTTEPTCTARGVKTYTCTFEGCGATYTEQIAMVDHTVVTDAAVPATCTETGLTEGSHCSACNTVIKAQETVPAIGHTEVKDAAVPATCTETGLTEGSHCSVCNEVIVAQQVTEKIPHSYTQKQTKAPTCTEAGEMTYTCSACGDSYTDEIDALGHSVKDDTVTKEATCTEDGEKAGVCERCGETAATEVIPATGHTWDEGKVTTEPTCTEKGVKTYACGVCGETKTEEIPATGAHTWDGGKVTTAATCTKKGVKTYACTVCGETKTEEIPAAGHVDQDKDNACDTCDYDLSSAQTGDNSMITVWIVLMVLSAAAIVLLVAKKRQLA